MSTCTQESSITFTQEALNELVSLRAQMGEEAAGKSLRLFVQKGGCSGFEYGMGFDAADPRDVVIELGQGEQAIVDPQSLNFLKGAKIHFTDGLEGRGFEIINPNAERTCGCGKSFTPECDEAPEAESACQMGDCKS